MEYLKDVLFELVADPVYSVREAAGSMMNALVEVLGLDYFEEYVIKDLINLQYFKSYLVRMNYLYIAKLVFQKFIGSKSEEVIENSIFFLLGDRVCNVRVYALRSLLVVYQFGNAEKQKSIKNSLLLLQDDEDIETKNLVNKFV